jgi:hypothetical protein
VNKNLTFNIHKKNKKIPIVAFLCTIIVLSCVATYAMVQAAPTEKIVYVVVNIDTESESGKFINSTDAMPDMDIDIFSTYPASSVTGVFDSSFRNTTNDSYGDTCKITWFVEMDYLTSKSLFWNATGIDGTLSGYTAILDLLRRNWGTQIQTYGDSIEYHHHFETYSSGIWQIADEGPSASYPDYQMYALDQMIINGSFYPSAFRSGWDLQSTPLTNWLEQWVPFDFSPLNLVSGWVPSHEYSGLNNWQAQSAYFPNYADIQHAFVQARDQGSSIYSTYMHSYSNMTGEITYLQSTLASLASNPTFSGVTFKYVTAKQAMQLALGYTDVTPPTFTVTRNNSTYIISSSETLWNNKPYVAVLYNSGTYSHLAATPVGNNTWTVNIPSSATVYKIGVAANDLFGNSAVSVFTPLTPPTGPIPTVSMPATQPPQIQIPVNGITVSSYYNSTYSPSKAIDSSVSSYWGTSSSEEFPQWLKLDLWSLVPVNQVTTHFYDFDSRAYTYYIDVSSDGSTWTTVVPSKIAGSIVTDTFTQVMARFVRITVTDNTANTAAHIIETAAYQATLSPTPSPSPTPTATPTPTPSPSPSPTPTATPTPTPSPSPSPTPTAVPTQSPTVTPTVHPTATVTPSPTPIPTASSSPTPIHTASPSPTSSAGTLIIQPYFYALAAVIIILAVVTVFLVIHKRKSLKL